MKKGKQRDEKKHETSPVRHLQLELQKLRRELRTTARVYTQRLEHELIAATDAAEIVVSIPDQTLALLDGDRVITRYRISTSKFGNGDNVGSYRTPLGTLFVSGKFGDRLPVGTVIKNRAPTGEVIAADAPNRDAIISRVIWLRGMERQNSAAHDRCITFMEHPKNATSGSLSASVAFGCGRAT